MVFTRSVGVGIALAALLARPAQAATPELSVTSAWRIAGRSRPARGHRSSASRTGGSMPTAGTSRARWAAIGMPPLKLARRASASASTSTGSGRPRRFTSGRGYARYALPSIDGLRLERTDFVPDGRRGALLGLKLTNPSRRAHDRQVTIDAHSELMAQYPWAFAGTARTRATTLRTAASTTAAASSSRTPGRSPGLSGTTHTALVGSDRDAATSGTIGPDPYCPVAEGRRCGAEARRRRRPACDDGPFGRGTGGRLRTCPAARPGGTRTVWLAVAGSGTPASARRARSSPSRTARPRTPSSPRRSAPRRAQLARRSRCSRCRATRLLQESIEWGKQNLADLTQTAEDLRDLLDEPGQAVDARGRRCRSMRWIGAGFPDYPWLFGVDGEYTAHAAVTLGQFDAIEDHMRALREISDQLSDRSGVVVHETVGRLRLVRLAPPTPGRTPARTSRRPGRPGPGPLPRRRLTPRRAGQLSTLLLVAGGAWGWKSWPQTPQVIGPGVYCLARIQNDRGGWQPQATLNRSPALPVGCCPSPS